MSDRRHIMDMGHKDAGGRRLTAAISDSFVMIIFFLHSPGVSTITSASYCTQVLLVLSTSKNPQHTPLSRVNTVADPEAEAMLINSKGLKCGVRH